MVVREICLMFVSSDYDNTIWSVLKKKSVLCRKCQSLVFVDSSVFLYTIMMTLFIRVRALYLFVFLHELNARLISGNEHEHVFVIN